MDRDQPIGPGLAFVLVALALIIDGIQFIFTLLIIGVAINPFIDLVATMAFTVILYHHSNTLLSRRAAALAMTTIGEIIPLINALPIWTAFAIFTIVADKIHHARDHHNGEGGGSSNVNPVRVPRPKRTWRL